MEKNIQYDDVINAAASAYTAYDNDYLLNYGGQELLKDFKALYSGYDISGANAEFLRRDKQQRAGIENALARMQLSNNQALTEAQMIRNLQAQNKTLKNRNALLQAGNDITLLGLSQGQRMERLVETQIQLQANHISVEQAEKVAEQKAVDKNISKNRAASIAIHKRFEEALTAGDKKRRLRDAWNKK